MSLNYIKESIDFAFTHGDVIELIKIRNHAGYEPCGINGRIVYVESYKKYLYRIAFDYFDRDKRDFEDFYVWLDWDGIQYHLLDIIETKEVK